MVAYTKWIDGYLMEAVYGTSLIANTNTQTYSLGVLSEEALHPSPVSDMIFGGTGVNSQEVPDGGAWKGPANNRGVYTVVMIDGLMIWMVMGKSSTSDSVHTVTPPTAVDGVLPELPSVTIQHDLTGTAPDWGTQHRGCKISQLTMKCSTGEPGLYSVVDWIAKDSINAGFISTNLPAFPATALEEDYHINNMTAKFDGGSIRDGLKEFEFSINPDFMPWRDSTRVIKALIEDVRKKYRLRFVHSPASSDLWDEANAEGNTKNMEFKWVRSATDYIQLDLTNCHIPYHEQTSPAFGQELLEEVIVEPEKVVFTIKDNIPAATYGE